jgi:hypothetical protein
VAIYLYVVLGFWYNDFSFILVLWMARFRGMLVQIIIRNNLLPSCSGSVRQIEVYKRFLQIVGRIFLLDEMLYTEDEPMYI